MEVGSSFSNFKDVEAALEKLKKEQYHPLRVYNSQSAADYNKKRANAKNPFPSVDTEQIPFTYYSVQCVHYRDPRQSAVTGGTLHTVNLTENICSCSFRRTWLMPCHHIFNVCLSLHIPISEEGMVSKRWLRSYQSAGMFDQAVYSTNYHASRASGIVSEQGRVHVSNLSTKSKLSGALARNQKFQKMQTLCQKLATMASHCGMPQFREKYAQIEIMGKECSRGHKYS